jgi:hypothetical protein
MTARAIRIHGEEYVRVKDRLQAMRRDHPDARVVTELVELDRERFFALFRARIELANGAVATGWGSECADDFGDYIEKAETKAIGRALVALGYGSDALLGSSEEAAEIDAVLAQLSDRARSFLLDLCANHQIDARDLLAAHKATTPQQVSSLMTLLKAGGRPVRSGDEALSQLAAIADRCGVRVQDLDAELRQHRGFDGNWARLRVADLLWAQARAVALARELGGGLL